MKRQVDQAVSHKETDHSLMMVRDRLWKVRKALYKIEQYDHGLQGKGIGLYELPVNFCYIVNGKPVAYPTKRQLEVYNQLVDH